MAEINVVHNTIQLMIFTPTVLISSRKNYENSSFSLMIYIRKLGNVNNDEKGLYSK